MSRYIRYQIINKEPIRIADDSVSQLGQVATLRHIPGSTMKGFVVNSLVRNLTEEELALLFSGKVRFLNAYVTVAADKEKKTAERELIPSPKGFYEDKEIKEGIKEIENVVIAGQFTDGFKRAAIGRYSYFEEDVLHYYGVETGSDLKITLGNEGQKRNVFRNEYIMPGYCFTGYIAVEDNEIAEKVKSVLSGDIYIGNAKSSGLGRCEVLTCDLLPENAIPYMPYAVSKDQSSECYMMLLSSTVMRGEYGEMEGLNLLTLQKKMGVENLKIQFCSTSTVNVSGYNRTLKSKTASLVAYEQGSVFHLTFDGTLTLDTAKSLMDEGIGMNRNEGFGRILFLDSYEKINKKQSGSQLELKAWTKGEASGEWISPAEDKAVLKLAARNYYKNLLEKAMMEYVVDSGRTKANINNSQAGIVEGLISANKYQPERAVEVLERYFTHVNEKESKEKVHKERKRVSGFGKKILDIMDQPIAVTLNKTFPETIFNLETAELLTKQELLRLKQDLVLMMIRFDNKKKEDK